LPGADYSETGGYFVTICAAGRRNIFGEIADGNVELSPLGTILRECWVAIPEHFASAESKEFVVMPNHLHDIVVLLVGARYIVPLDRTARQTESDWGRHLAAELIRARFCGMGKNMRTQAGTF